MPRWTESAAVATEEVMHYQELSGEYLRHGRALLAEGDLTQASEKGWGAAATSVKAVAASRGLEHNGHFLLRRIVRQLVEETGDNELSERFGLAESLHINFYEARLPAEDVELYLGHVERLVGKLGEMASGMALDRVIEASAEVKQSQAEIETWMAEVMAQQARRL